jgi:uncharacterized lipoprotein YajG
MIKNNLAISFFVGIFITLISFFALGSLKAQAEPSTIVTLEAPGTLAKQICPQPLWNNITAVWGGVKDERPAPEVGGQDQGKGKDPLSVFSSIPLNQVFDQALRKILPVCGIKLIDSGTDEELHLSIEINDFYSGVNKKFFTSTAKSTSKLTVIAQHSGATTLMVNVGDEIESKRGRQKDVKQMTASLNELLADTIKQMVQSKELQTLK